MERRGRRRLATRVRGHDVFAAVGDPTRRKVLDLLVGGELAAGEIAAPFSITRPAVSQHLRILRRAGLVTVRRQGREQIYGLRAKPLRQVHDWVGHYERFWNEKLVALGQYLDER
jgi:DNA-binding transcriptional ArsR family regulator